MKKAGYLISSGGFMLVLEFILILCDYVTVELPDHKIDTLSITLSIAAWVFLLAGFVRLYKINFLNNKNKLLWISISGLVFYVLGCLFIMLELWNFILIVPVGLLLTASGTIVIGLYIIFMNLLRRWHKLTFLLAGLYPFVFMFPIVAICGSPNYLVNYLWGVPWIIAGYSLHRNGK
jgi:hypothetical protein